MIKPVVQIFSDIEKLSEHVAAAIKTGVENLPEGKLFTLSLSGGNTPRLIFAYLAMKYADKIEWSKVGFFWGDERCVAPEHADSNYTMALESLLSKVPAKNGNVFRVRGEDNPEEEAVRYANVLSAQLTLINNAPAFDLLLLGLGEDGHVASIFPDRLDLFESPEFCAAVRHPVSGQKRITITGPVINNARQTMVLATGKNKARIVAEILENHRGGKLPAELLAPQNGTLTWLLDEESAGLLESFR